ncbi:metalloendopeptidase OMA1, mitochondrial-like [Mercenaria mercenaria]|uniref:metalloendopeptidase OMA1, mitochondrial-like n=1 Tax=Mercenaria mercenaria TaxID=6596 RepID=UPI00234EFC0F|nr:metalloendopeptidase OMA1, mitochondrial-like [Mercenaria mercenaria]XP_053395295.1 metalloendopeptidase OMA1, mitochondrial-like [Mercenaria mercenaria]XP_053395296.1 metalloendopeptidase OMA1, mitochondrial-like [Mercenaria mercenaria]XP_053395297.1 metalloendopeptidase OMA1, mitochondrial-like [Mercenaria mercenaria]XP_053395298.1 metalloendopeptidase OMA1, mitochondrial-like [Mercenaria mercenaria]
MEKCLFLCCRSQIRLPLFTKTVGRYLSRYRQQNAVILHLRTYNSHLVLQSTQQCSKERTFEGLRSDLTQKSINSSQLAGVYIRQHGFVCTAGARQFHTSGRKDAFPPLIWAVVSFATKAGAVLTGRRYRNWLKTRPEEEQKKHHRRILQFWAALAAFGATLATIYYTSHLQECPITGRKRFITLTKDQYLKVADYESENFLDLYNNKTLPPTHQFYNMVLQTAQSIVRANQDFPGMKEQKWVIHVVEDEERNAFVLPNGHIFVFTGMLKFVENEDQFAFILGHEMSHALLLHGAEQLSYGQFLDYIVIGVMAGIWTLMPNDGIAVVTNWFYNKVMDLTVHMPYSRVLEKEADKVGLHLIAKACYDVREGSVLWYRMSIADDITGEGRIPEWLSTHPTHGNRVKHIDHLIPKAVEERESCKCDRLSDLDPRKRAIRMRKAADNIMIARASKANIDRAHKDHQKPVIPTFQSPIPTLRKGLDESES